MHVIHLAVAVCAIEVLHSQSVACLCLCLQTVNPRDSKSAPVFQLETAMGSAIECFEGAGRLF